MQGKNIKVHLKRKIGDWVSSVDDEAIKDAISDNAIITGGAIVSLLQDEKPHDYDVYFRNEKALIQVAEYYVKKYTHSNVYGCCRHVCAMQCRSSLFDRNGYDRQ